MQKRTNRRHFKLMIIQPTIHPSIHLLALLGLKTSDFQICGPRFELCPHTHINRAHTSVRRKPRESRMVLLELLFLRTQPVILRQELAKPAHSKVGNVEFLVADVNPHNGPLFLLRWIWSKLAQHASCRRLQIVQRCWASEPLWHLWSLQRRGDPVTQMTFFPMWSIE